jgi:hypothetical protein
VLLSALYPTIFALANNWYAVSPGKIAWLLAAAAVAGVAVYALAELAVAVIGWVSAASGLRPRESLISALRRCLFAVVCPALLFALLAGTLSILLKSFAAVGIAFVATVVGLCFLFGHGRQRYFNVALGFLTLLAAGTWLLSLGKHYISAAESATIIDRKEAFELAQLTERPNIYFFIYDAYGSDAAYRNVFGFDNSEHYRSLAGRGFKVVHTFSNYWWTWPTVLSVFLGNHNYYRMVDGIHDTSQGRKVMAGWRHNPVFETLRSNEYRIQQIHGSDYFVAERGSLDYVFPEEPVYGALKIYSSPLLDRLFSKEVSHWGRDIVEQKEVLLSRLPAPPAGEVGPWLTFSHVAVPGHGPTDKDWRALETFEKTFVDLTVRANVHMLAVMDAIAAKDPQAIVVIIGDHGAWRYRGVWTVDPDPNRAFEKEGLAPETVTNDLFGVMIAVRSAGRCDDYVYPGVTPVNIMRVVFACLARDPKLLEGRPGDVSIAWVGNLWLVAKDGRALGEWQAYAP